jgi:hypothetical protein
MNITTILFNTDHAYSDLVSLAYRTATAVGEGKADKPAPLD